MTVGILTMQPRHLSLFFPGSCLVFCRARSEDRVSATRSLCCQLLMCSFHQSFLPRLPCIYDSAKGRVFWKFPHITSRWEEGGGAAG